MEGRRRTWWARIIGSCYVTVATTWTSTLFHLSVPPTLVHLRNILLPSPGEELMGILILRDSAIYVQHLAQGSQLFLQHLTHVRLHNLYMFMEYLL